MGAVLQAAVKQLLQPESTIETDRTRSVIHIIRSWPLLMPSAQKICCGAAFILSTHTHPTHPLTHPPLGFPWGHTTSLTWGAGVCKQLTCCSTFWSWELNCSRLLLCWSSRLLPYCGLAPAGCIANRHPASQQHPRCNHGQHQRLPPLTWPQDCYS
jgi:hypothetical protein